MPGPLWCQSAVHAVRVTDKETMNSPEWTVPQRGKHTIHILVTVHQVLLPFLEYLWGFYIVDIN